VAYNAAVEGLRGGRVQLPAGADAAPRATDGRGGRADACSSERSLRQLLRLAGSHRVRIAIENLAPLYAGPELVCHDLGAVDALARRLGNRQAGICLDIGHANIVAGLIGRELIELVEPVLDRVILFHVHDNFGAGSDRPRAGGIEPLRLDLHLPPGAGTVPWPQLAPLVSAHHAPLQLEIHPAGRPEPANLAVVTREILGGMITTQPRSAWPG
jgi:sugar phosphate isomerase/epimerase